MKIWDQTLETVIDGTGANPDIWLYIGPDDETGVACVNGASGLAQEWAALFKAAPRMARAIAGLLDTHAKHADSPEAKAAWALLDEIGWKP